jgi:N-acylneuraminate cytidylyltransferase
MSELKTVAIITARGGSKRIKRKNIKMFLGAPIISYSIKAALETSCFDEVMVSTDDDEVADIARECGAMVPFMRSEKNSDDYSTTYDVIEEVLNSYSERGMSFEYGCCIYPTAPFVNSKKLITAFELLSASQALSLVPVTKFSYPILRSLKIEDGLLKMNWPEHLNSRSQELPQSYHDCGQFYFFNTEGILREKKLFTDNTIAMEIPESEVQDIDTEEDWKLAEIKYSFLQKQK